MELKEPSRELQHGPEKFVDLGLGLTASTGQATGQIDVAAGVDGERHSAGAHIALQQPAVDALDVLLRGAGDERVDRERVGADDERAGGAQLALARDGDHEGVRLGLVERQLGGFERLADGLAAVA